jgi:hypothetical protein
LPHIIWDFFETIWLYSADDEEELEIALRVGDEINFQKLERLNGMKGEMSDDQSFNNAWKVFKKFCRNPKLNS